MRDLGLVLLILGGMVLVAMLVETFSKAGARQRRVDRLRGLSDEEL